MMDGVMHYGGRYNGLKNSELQGRQLEQWIAKFARICTQMLIDSAKSGKELFAVPACGSLLMQCLDRLFDLARDRYLKIRLLTVAGTCHVVFSSNNLCASSNSFNKSSIGVPSSSSVKRCRSSAVKEARDKANASAISSGESSLISGKMSTSSGLRSFMMNPTRLLDTH
jgi:hypothetical protein